MIVGDLAKIEKPIRALDLGEVKVIDVGGLRGLQKAVSCRELAA